MADEMLASVGKYLTIEIINGKKISGTLLEANGHFIRLQVDNRIATVPLSALTVIWDGEGKETLTEENMEYLANQLRAEVEERVVCTSFPGFNCVNQYVCIPPDICTNTFACPGFYTPGQPQGAAAPMVFSSPALSISNSPAVLISTNPVALDFSSSPVGYDLPNPVLTYSSSPVVCPSVATPPVVSAVPARPLLGLLPRARRSSYGE